MKRVKHTSYVFGRSYLRFLPVLVWLAVVIAVVGLFSHRARRFEVLGIAQGRVYQVAATSTCRLKNVPVELFDEVKQGQTLAIVNTILENEAQPEEIRAQLATIQAEAEHLMAQLAPTQDALLADKSDLKTNRLDNMRRFAVDVENTRLEILRLRALIESDRILLQDLTLEVKIVQGLVKREAVGSYELQKAKVQYNALKKTVEENEHLLEQAKKHLQQALQREGEYAQYQPYHPSVESALEVIRKAAKVQEQLMAELLVTLEALESREALELKAPFDGVVTYAQDRTGKLVLRRAGEVVLAGEPILTVTETKPREILAYIREDQAHLIQEGTKVKLVKDSEPKQIAYSSITYIGPAVKQMPVRWWRNPNFPQWGRPFRVEVPAQMKLVIGERVGIIRL